MKTPWYAWLILALAWAVVTGIFAVVFIVAPVGGLEKLRWALGIPLTVLPTIIVLPFVISGIRR